MHDLREGCKHCGAAIGEMCKTNCDANGELVFELDAVLGKLNLKRIGLSLISTLVEDAGGET